MVEEVAVNWWAILTAVPISMTIGALWYSPIAFGNRWMKKLGKRPEDFTGTAGMVIGYAGAAVGAFLTAWVLATILAFASTLNALEGMLGAFFCWMGFVAATSFVNDAMSRASLSLWTINAAFRLVEFLALGALLGAWQ
jgi:hypothetical protein